MKKIISLTVILVCLLNSKAQDIGIGEWKDYLPYNNSISVCKIDNRIYTATENSLFYVDTENKSIERLNKINGMSDVGISCMEKDPNNNIILVAYESAIIDILKDDSVFSIKDIERENIIGQKKINNITFYNNNAYLSCSFGVIELDVIKREILNTFYLSPMGNLNIIDVEFKNEIIYAATPQGIYLAEMNSNLSDFNSWSLIAEKTGINDLETAFGRLYLTIENSDSIFTYEDSITNLVRVEGLRFIETVEGRLFAGSTGKIDELNQYNQLINITESSSIEYITDIYFDEEYYWAAEEKRSLVSISNTEQVKFYHPQGPVTNLAYTINFSDDKLFISPGGLSVVWGNNFTYEGFYWANGYDWNNVPYTSLAGTRDVTKIVGASNGDLFLGTWNDGVLHLKYSEEINNYILYKEYNHITTGGDLETLENGPNADNYGWLRIRGMVFDENGLLWITNSMTEKGLAFMNTNEEWQSLEIKSYNTTNSNLGDITIDESGQKWFYIGRGGGIIVYDDNGTPDLTSDDKDKRLSTTAGSGGLPSNFVHSIAKDRDGEIWVGTDKGVAVFYSPENIFDLNNDAQLILVENDGYVEPIIANETVKAIAIDGANRKWFGTQSSGVFVYSDDGTEQIHHFNTNNSPIFSDNINDIKINQKTGEVYIATEKGLISYLNGAIESTSSSQNVLVYPNPVREDYYGPIAVKNVVENASVKITDINGNLISSFTALGGQAVWDGKNQFGERPSTGVYLVFTTNPTGTETNVAKILFIK